MNRFVSKEPFTIGTEIVLEASQSHHLTKVLRMQPGETLGLVNGQGGLARAELVEARAKGARVRIQEVVQGHKRSRIRLCFAIPKGQASDFIFRRATELGVHSFQPLETKFSAALKTWNSDRWPGVVSEVCKQCEELFFPEILPPQPLGHWLLHRDRSREMIYCDENARMDKSTVEGAAYDLVIGAEGGWEASESQLLRQYGAKGMGLGVNRLRAETAALVSLALLKKQIAEI